jgi:hypothetical protein
MGAGAAVVAALVAVFLVFAATSSKSVDPIAQAATVSANAPGYRMNLNFVITSPELSGPISVSGSSIVDLPDHALSMSLDMNMSAMPQVGETLGSSTLQLRAVLEGQRLYVKFPDAIVSRLPELGGKPWVVVNVAKAAALPGLSSIGGDPATTDPTQILKELEAGAESITNEGQQVVDGVQTTHYRADLNLGRLLTNQPSGEQAILQKMLQGQQIPIDVWVDAHHLVRRMDMSLAIGVGSNASLEETATADFSDYGPQSRPTPPPANQVTDGSVIPGVSS